jgi:3-oxoacyl-[acyl-carrier-protein] synthase II
MSERRVVVTGLGVVSPLGVGVEPSFEALLAGRCGIRRIEAFDPSRFDSQIAEFRVQDYVPRSYRKATKVMARDIELAVGAAYEAVKDAGLKTRCLLERGEADPPTNVDPARLGANIGAGLLCADLTELAAAVATAVEDGQFSLARWGRDGINNLTPLWLLKYLPNMLACHVTIVHDAQGASNTITCGEASSHLAIGEAFRTIARGGLEACICGGAESKLSPMGLIRQALLGRLATEDNDRPEAACRPFDADRRGTVISEGSGLLVLEGLEHALARRAGIYAELVGFGAANNVRSWSQPDPEGRGLRLAVDKALADAKTEPQQVDLVVALGSGLPEHDLSEARGLGAALGAHAGVVPVMATKGSLGNNGAGSGAIDLALACQAMRRGVVPASRNTQHPDPRCGLRVVTGEPLQARINTILAVSYALGGGQNAALVLRRYAG